MSFSKILRHNLPEYQYLLLGCFGSFLFGSAPFLFGITMGHIFEVSKRFFILVVIMNCCECIKACGNS